jgi:hypothetical protein
LARGAAACAGDFTAAFGGSCFAGALAFAAGFEPWTGALAFVLVFNWVFFFADILSFSL